MKTPVYRPRDQTIGLIMETADPVSADSPGAPVDEDLKPYVVLAQIRITGWQASGGYWRHPGNTGPCSTLPGSSPDWMQGMCERYTLRIPGLRGKPQSRSRSEPEPGEVWDEPEYTPPVKVFDGTVRLRKSRFLHLDVDFAYFPDTLEQPDLEMPAQAARYTGGSRRTTSG